MITDAQLEAQLNALQAVTPSENEQFASVEDFKTRFFARVRALDEATPQKSAKPVSDRDERPLIEDGFGHQPWGIPALFSKMMPSFSLFAGAGIMKCCEKRMVLESRSDIEVADFFEDTGSSLPIDFSTEEYRSVTETPFVASARNPLSTFGADVDTAGYTNARKVIMERDRLPEADSVRIDEFLNYFRYNYPAPADGADLRPHFEFADAPWAPGHKLLLVGIQARDIAKDKLPPSHFVFLIDNSGSMCDVMNIVKEAMGMLTRQLRPQDKVSVVTYGGEVRTLLEGSGDAKATLAAIASLKAEGCTPGGKAIQKAYALAHEHFIPGGNNRIVLITDGDFNVGASSEAGLTSMVEQERGKGIYLSVIGAGCGNYKDNRMKMLANKGDGNYIYIDTIAEARRAFTQGLTGQMFTIAHDVKFQLEFNPARVYAYRLLGYELRRMADTDFRDDSKDSGEIGVGQQVTALYEIIPAEAAAEVKSAAIPDAPPLRYSTVAAIGSDELLTFHLRYQQPQGGNAVEQEFPVPTANAGENLDWAAAVAEFALLLRNSRFKGNASFQETLKLAKAGLGPDMDDDRLGFIQMVKRASEIKK
ncbi:MAG: von Willebrand factor type A domain-containing protein [Victivallales bacterium]|nr:von Willebrand factor type A domain-containing protein [Victivallales bacterium]